MLCCVCASISTVSSRLAFVVCRAAIVRPSRGYASCPSRNQSNFLIIYREILHSLSDNYSIIDHCSPRQLC
jgi:hypothetical protein